MQSAEEKVATISLPTVCWGQVGGQPLCSTLLARVEATGGSPPELGKGSRGQTGFELTGALAAALHLTGTRLYPGRETHRDVTFPKND